MRVWTRADEGDVGVELYHGNLVRDTTTVETQMLTNDAGSRLSSPSQVAGTMHAQDGSRVYSHALHCSDVRCESSQTTPHLELTPLAAQ